MLAKPDTDLTVEELKAWLHYEPETGIFRWIQKPNRCIPIRSEAGHKEKNGYYRIRLNGKVYGLHRLAWFYMTGTWPMPTCDHRDGDQANNKWENLRQASNAENQFNHKISAANTSGIKGVRWEEHRQKWSASFKFKYQTIRLGRFRVLQDAIDAITTKRNELHGSYANHG